MLTVTSFLQSLGSPFAEAESNGVEPPRRRVGFVQKGVAGRLHERPSLPRTSAVAIYDHNASLSFASLSLPVHPHSSFSSSLSANSSSSSSSSFFPFSSSSSFSASLSHSSSTPSVTSSSSSMPSRRLLSIADVERKPPRDASSLARLLLDVVGREMRDCSLVLATDGRLETTQVTRHLLALPNARQVGCGRARPGLWPHVARFSILLFSFRRLWILFFPLFSFIS